MLNREQFQFHYEENPDDELEQHAIYAYPHGQQTTAGSMIWSGGSGPLQSIEVDPAYRRQGLATQMWKHAQKLAQDNPDIAMPVHSAFRTPEGDAWAKSTGEWLPNNQY